MGSGQFPTGEIGKGEIFQGHSNGEAAWSLNPSVCHSKDIGEDFRDACEAAILPFFWVNLGDR